ncbi:MAG: SGNH/GDSL hydrolase family protein [Polyangiaceae bacterium]
MLAALTACASRSATSLGDGPGPTDEARPLTMGGPSAPTEADATASASGCTVVASPGPWHGDAEADASPTAADADVDARDGGAAWLPPRAYVYGNSLVWGSELPAATAATDRFPAQLATRLGTRWATDQWIGRSGWSTSMLITAAPHDLAAATAEQGRARKVLVFWEGVNELGNPWACEAYEIMTRRRVAEGWSVVLMTATPTKLTADLGEGASPAPSPYWRDVRRSFNACVVTNGASWGAAAVVDLSTLTELSDPWDTQYFLDGTHLTAASYALIADRVAPVVDALYTAPTP